MAIGRGPSRSAVVLKFELPRANFAGPFDAASLASRSIDLAREDGRIAAREMVDADRNNQVSQ